MNANTLFKEENFANIDLRNKIFRNIQKGVEGDLVYKIQKNTCFVNEIFLFSHDLKEIQSALMTLRKY